MKRCEVCSRPKRSKRRQSFRFCWTCATAYGLAYEEAFELGTAERIHQTKYGRDLPRKPTANDLRILGQYEAERLPGEGILSWLGANPKVVLQGMSSRYQES